MSEEAIPLSISYTDADVSNAAKRDRFAVGTYRGVVTDITRQISKEAGHLMFKVVYRALRDPNDAGSIYGPALYYYQCLPFRNPNRDDHVPAKFFSRSTNEWLAAHTDDVKRLPVRTQEGLVYDGETIDFADEEEKRREAYETSFAKAAEMWEDESNELLEALKGSAVFFDVNYQEGRDFPSLGGFRPELNDGDTLVDPETALQTVATEAVEEVPKKNGKTNGVNGHAKPAAKQAKKAAKKR